MSHKSGHIITFSSPIREGSKIKVWHCVVVLGIVVAAVMVLLF